MLTNYNVVLPKEKKVKRSELYRKCYYRNKQLQKERERHSRLSYIPLIQVEEAIEDMEACVKCVPCFAKDYTIVFENLAFETEEDEFWGTRDIQVVYGRMKRKRGHHKGMDPEVVIHRSVLNKTHIEEVEDYLLSKHDDYDTYQLIQALETDKKTHL